MLVVGLKPGTVPVKNPQMCADGRPNQTLLYMLASNDKIHKRCTCKIAQILSEKSMKDRWF